MVGSVLVDGWRVYRLLFRRSILVSTAVYAAIAALTAAEHAGLGFGAASFAAGLVGPVLVQGALVAIVEDAHEGRRPRGVGALVEGTGRRLVTLVAASIVYGFAVIIGLVLFVVPGLLAAARLALMPPAIMLEKRRFLDAYERSREIVIGHTSVALGVVVSAFAITDIPWLALSLADRSWPAWQGIVAENAFAALTAPFSAHILSVLYYRLTDPARPAIDPAVRSWRSVWAGPAA